MFGFFESSRTLGQPLELFYFESGAKIFAYCNGEKPFEFNGVMYEPLPIRHSAINSSGTLDKQTLTVDVAETSALATTLRSGPSSSVTTMTLRQGHKDDPDKNFLVAWVGRVLGTQGNAEDGTRSLTCQPASTSLKRIGLRRNWQFGCPHVLYGDQCRADMVRASVAAAAVSAQGRSVQLPAGWNGDKPAEKFVGGLLFWSTEIRTIVRVLGNTVMVGEPVSLEPGTALTLALGCDHLRDDCSTLHRPRDEANYGGGNIRNFGGQPFIPQLNPIGFVSNYS